MTPQTLAQTAPANEHQERVDHTAAATALLVREIEQYLTARCRTTAHPLVTKTTAELIEEALSLPSAPGEPVSVLVLTPPARALRLLPDWVLSVPVLRQLHGAGRHVSVAEHLELTALVIERFGWSRSLLSASGRRCILGAQAVLYRLGYGDEGTARAAGNAIQDVLATRGITEPYHRWNDAPGRTREEVLHLLRTTADSARADSRR